MAQLSIRNYTRHTSLPRSAFLRAARGVLPGWDISLVLVGETRARGLNRTLRKKTYTPNVLSFALSEKAGEIILCPEVAKRQAPTYDMSTRTFLFLLFIHGLLHLKGWRHGATMEKRERTLVARYLHV